MTMTTLYETTREVEDAIAATISAYREAYGLTDEQVSIAVDNTNTFEAPALDDVGGWVEVFAACLGGVAEEDI